MKRRFSCCLILVLAVAGISRTSRADWVGDIEHTLADKELSRAQVGVEIVRLGSGPEDTPVLYQHDSAEPLIPASNLKAITTSAALEKLGANFKFRTLLLLHGSDLVLIGDGDPTLGDAEILKKVGWDANTVFKMWADGLIKKNVHGVHNLLIDDSVFDQQFTNPDWPANQLQLRYSAAVAGLNLNANCLDIYIEPNGYGQRVRYQTDPPTTYYSIENDCLSGGHNSVWYSRDPQSNQLILRGSASEANDVPVSITVQDPSMFTGTVLADTLRAEGLRISGQVRRDLSQRSAYLNRAANDDSWALLAIHETPLPNVIARANKDSMNLYAECICKRLGFADSGVGSWQSGTHAVGDFLRSIGVPPSQFTLDDGCGLSKVNRISAHLMVTVLKHDFYGPNSAIWLKSLAIAGEDGTLADRFRGSDLRGRVIAKTGFVNGVSCLSGFLHAKDDNWYCFSIMFNGIPEHSNSGAKALQERIVKALDEHATALAQARAN